MKKNAGFTLVELIIVIAILGILAGVAIPVYSGYVEKANQSADDQLIAAVNTAAAAAVLEARGVAMGTLGNRALEADTDTLPITVSDPAEANVATAFAKYFTGNETASLKYYDRLEFKDHKFVGVKNGGAANAWVTGQVTEEGVLYYTFTNGDKTVKVSAADLAALNASTFMTGMDISTLTGDIDSVVRAASGLVTGENISKIAGFSDWLAQKGIDPNDSDKVAKALVLYTAMNTSGTASDIVTQVKNGSFATEFRTAISAPDKTKAFVDAAMAYAMVEAFAKTEEGKNATVSVGGKSMKVPDYLASVNASLGSKGDGARELDAVLDMLNTVSTNKFFQAYRDGKAPSGANATQDLSGYLSSMNALSGNINNIDMDTYLSEGMSGDYITSLMEQFKTSGG